MLSFWAASRASTHRALGLFAGARSQPRLISLAGSLSGPGLDRRGRSVFMCTMATGGEKRNRLGLEKSPYLLQHANNPVDWHSWGDEAFNKAKTEDKPIFLSVGYSTCHWCHVMEHESFNNPEVASILNDNYICIKVDREERPDVDEVYMAFVQATCGRGGWPMSVWLTPELKPFVGGTYFPPEDRLSHPGFITLLLRISEEWRTNRQSMVDCGEGMLSKMQKGLQLRSLDAAEMPSASTVSQKCFLQLSDLYDEEHGGFGEAPKFPSPTNLAFLMGFWASERNSVDGVRALEMALHTLHMMAHGGMRDHVGQGFHRYSTDGLWHVPHFEKMLYDQAQLAVAYAHAFQITRDEFYANVAQDVLLYMGRELLNEEGGFYSAEDADSLPSPDAKEKKEGAFYVWTEAKIRELLGESLAESTEGATLADVFIYHYWVKENGNVNSAQDPYGELAGQNVLHEAYSIELTADRFGLSRESLQKNLDSARKTLFEARKSRPRPHLDTKLLASWNGLAMSAYARAGAILGEERFLEQATGIAHFLQTHLYNSSMTDLLHSTYLGSQGTIEQLDDPVPGMLSDYAFVIRGLLDLYEARQDTASLDWAACLQQRQNELFWDSKGLAYFTTPASRPGPLFRMKEDQDGAEPMGNSVSASNLLRLAIVAGRPEWEEQAVQLLQAFGELLIKVPMAVPEMVYCLLTYHSPVKQVVIRGEPSEEDTRAMIRCVHSIFLPYKVLILADGNKCGFLDQQLPFLNRLDKKGGKATAYVCENFTCSSPVSSVEELKKQLLQ
uniref:spermatogenesis-associated protein 20 isoform X1 n=2 Tax=Myxine glutinosa TaxID=7769 RepID=UPI00358EC788